MNRIFTKPVCLAFLFFFASLSVHAQSSIVLNGSNQYISFGNNAALNATNIKTMECWVKFNSLSGTQEITSRSITNAGIELLLFGNELSFYCMQSVSSYSYVHVPISTVGLVVNTWYHMAVTWDGTRASMKIYVNGVSVAEGTRVDGGNIESGGITNPTGTFRIGHWSDAEARYLNGTVDEAKVWSINRTAAQIKASMFDVATNTTGLIAYYKMNEGSGGTTANAVASTGTVLNGTLTGPTTPGWSTSPVQSAGNGLNFDGVNDQVSIATNTLFNFTAGGTIEMWVQPSNLTTVTPVTLIGNRGNSGIRYSFDMTTAGLGFRNNSGRTTVARTFVNGTWYHVAFVYNGSTTVTAYVDGALAGTFTQSISTGITGQPLTLGIGKTTIGDIEPFSGNMDEVRVWSTQRTLAQIQKGKGVTVSPTATGLVAQYVFNQGNASGDNTGMTFVLDRTSNNLNARLVNFALTAVSGPVSNYVSTSALALPVSLTNFSATRDNDQVVLQWETEQEQNSRDFTVERSTDGEHFTAIGTLAAAGNSTVKKSYSFTDNAPAAGVNYYRLLQRDFDDEFTYSRTVAVELQLLVGMQIAPNPARGGLVNYVVNSLRQAHASVSVTDMSGKKLITRVLALQPGVNRLTLDVSTLPAGTYTMQVTNTAAGQQTSRQLMIVR